jgi:hypothetical protein
MSIHSLKGDISACLYYFLYRRLLVYVHRAALLGATVHACIKSYTDASQFMAMQQT